MGDMIPKQSYYYYERTDPNEIEIVSSYYEIM